jgi:AbiV family abortive infection protein
MDLQAVKSADGAVLAAAAAATQRNAASLAHEAEALALEGYAGRACTLAGLAVEEVGKVVGFAALAGMPEQLRAQAPVGRMLGWHQLKQVTGGLLAAVRAGPPDSGAALLAMPAGDIDQVLNGLEEPADEADYLKRAGMYVDINRDGEISAPARITTDEADRQIDRARQATQAARSLLDPAVQLVVAHPSAGEVELTRAAVSAIIRAGSSRTSGAAADVVVWAVRTLIAVRRNDLTV